MNLREFILPLTCALAGTLLIHYFFLSEQKPILEQPSDRHFVAPATVQVAEPLDLDIDYYDAPSKREKEDTVVSLPTKRIQFSNDGAVINFMGFARELGGKLTLVETLVPSQSTKKGSFLVALNGIGKTPYYYTLVYSIVWGILFPMYCVYNHALGLKAMICTLKNNIYIL